MHNAHTYEFNKFNMTTQQLLHSNAGCVADYLPLIAPSFTISHQNLETISHQRVCG